MGREGLCRTNCLRILRKLSTFQKKGEASRRGELNPRPTHYECVALPLSYSGAIPDTRAGPET